MCHAYGVKGDGLRMTHSLSGLTVLILAQQADEVLSELSTLFKGFGKLAPGSIGKRTLDPTGLRLALANLDPKRFAAGRASIRDRPQLHTLSLLRRSLNLLASGTTMPLAWEFASM